MDDLDKILSDEGFQELSRKAEVNYYPWDKVRLIAGSYGVDPEVAWAVLKLGRMQRYRPLLLKGHKDSRVRYVLPDPVQHELMMIDQQLAGQVTMSDEEPLNPSQRERFIISALREEAIASSMLEGAATTRREAKQMLRSGRKPRTRGEQMVLNNYHAIMFIRENRGSDLTPDFLLELQGILTHDTLDNSDEVGRFRNESDNNIVVEDQRDNTVIHTPPPASELPDRMRTLCDFANCRQPKRDGFIHPVVRASILHYQIGFDHPFCDGNGRTARALFYWLMLRRGYWLFEYLPISRLIYRGPAKYAKAFLYTETDGFDVTYFLTYKARIIERARRELRKYISERQAEISKARHVFQGDRRLNHRQREIILQAARNPDRYFTIASHQNKHRISYDTARTDLLDLVDWGYFRQEQVGRRYEFVAGSKINELDED